MRLKTVKVPKGMEKAFARAEKIVSGYFSKVMLDPSDGMIEIFGERYILVRAAALSCEFFEFVRQLFPDGHRAEADAFSRNMLFDLAHAIGRTDAAEFHRKMKLGGAIDKLSAGPVHFAHCGWASVDIHPESNPVANDDFCLFYDHPYSFEADAWIAERRRADYPVCSMGAGYAAGWCEESFGLPLVASEIECRARGDKHCRFIMAPPDRIEARIREFSDGHLHSVSPASEYEIPDLFARKRAEEALEKSEELYRTLVESSQDHIFVVGEDGLFHYVNDVTAGLFGTRSADMQGRRMEDFFPALTFGAMWRSISSVLESGQRFIADTPIDLPERRIWFSMTLLPIRGEGGRVTAVLCNARDITLRKRVEERITLLNDTLVRFGTDPEKNISLLVESCGLLMGATCAFYGRQENGGLCTLGKWSQLPGFEPSSCADGNVFLDPVKSDGDDVVVIRDLLKTPYAKSDPSILVYNLQTYVGRAVRLDGSSTGSLSCLYQRDFLPSDSERKMMGIVAAVISNEEARLRAKQALERQLHFLQELIDSIPAPVFFKGVDGRYLGCNRAFEAFVGMGRKEITGKTVFEVWPEDLAQGYHEKDERVFRDGASQTYELGIVYADGVRHDVVFHKALFRLPDGTAGGLVGTMIDITERKRANDALQERIGEVERLDRFLVGREGRILELKEEVNSLLQQMGQAPKYTI